MSAADRGIPNLTDLDQTAGLLRLGKPVVIPTDTVYGLALMVSDSTGPDILFQIKRRPPEKSIPWLVGSFADFKRYTRDLPEWACQLARRHWPGALTLVCMASDQAPRQFVAEDGSLAVRMPGHSLVLELLAKLDAPLATTSANLSGQPSVSRLEELDPLIVSQVAAVLADHDDLPGGIRALPTDSVANFTGTGTRNDSNDQGREALPSTIVSCITRIPVVLRQGALDLSSELSTIQQTLS